MAGDTKNAGSWSMADVLVGDLTAPIPAIGAQFDTTPEPTPGKWSFIGLLDGGQGFEEGRESDSKKHFAWGSILVEETDSKYEEEKTFTALEDNPVILSIVKPGSTFVQEGDVLKGTEIVPSKTKFKAAFVVRRGDGTMERRITKGYAQLSGWPTASQTEDDLASRKVTVSIYPAFNSATGRWELWATHLGPALAVEGAPAPVTP